MLSNSGRTVGDQWQRLCQSCHAKLQPRASTVGVFQECMKEESAELRMKKCSRCRLVFYCSTECQVSHFSSRVCGLPDSTGLKQTRQCRNYLVSWQPRAPVPGEVKRLYSKSRQSRGITEHDGEQQSGQQGLLS